jgi:hypothetical protein
MLGLPEIRKEVGAIDKALTFKDSLTAGDVQERIFSQ